MQAKADSAREQAKTQTERIQPEADSVPEKAKLSQTGEDDRTPRRRAPDIVAAAARMGWRMGGKRELKKLAEHLYEGETVRFIAQGTYEGDQGIVVLTDVRLLFLFHGVMRQRKEDFPLRLISSVQTKSGWGTGEIKVWVSGNSASISGIVRVRPGTSRRRGPTGNSHPARGSPNCAVRLNLPTTRTRRCGSSRHFATPVC